MNRYRVGLILKGAKSKFRVLWLQFWEIVKWLVTFSTYVAMLVGTVRVVYYGFIKTDILQLVIAIAVTLLVSYINKVNPQ